MTPRRGTEKGFEYVGGDVALDFVNTVDWRLSAERRRELVTTYGRLLEWAVGTDLVAVSRARRLAGLARTHPQHAATVVRRAHALREAIARLAYSISHGDRRTSADLRVLDAALLSAHANLVLGDARTKLEWRFSPRGGLDLEEPLWPIARSAAALLTSDDVSRIARCGDAACGWMYVDRSRNRSRRWCSMAGCGSRNKARRYYRRTRSV